MSQTFGGGMAGLRFCAYQYQHLPLDALRGRWRDAERSGFDVLWNCDTVVEPDRPRHTMFDGPATLTMMAADTTRIRVGTVVTSLYFRQPVPFAKASMTVDHLSGGRVELALGMGDPSAGAKASGVDWPAGERVARFGEFVELVGLLLSQEVTTYHGQFYRLQDGEMVPRSRCAAGWVRTAGSSGKLMTGASGVPGVFQCGARRAEARAH